MRPLLCVFILFSVSPVHAASLTAQEIRDHLVGRDISWWENDGWHAGALYLLPDGKAEISVDVPESTNDFGRWTLNGDEICTLWNSVRSGEMKCYSIQPGDKQGQFLTSGGNVFVIHDVGV